MVWVTGAHSGAATNVLRICRPKAVFTQRTTNTA